MNYLMGIDLGTSSVKVIIMDLKGRVVGSSQKEYKVDAPQAGYAEQDIELLWQETKSVIKGAISGSRINISDLKGIGFSGQMHGLVLVDKLCKPIRPAIIWCDQRSTKEINEIYEKIGKEDFRNITYNSLSTGFYICSLMWIKHNESDNYKKTYKAILPKDYIRYKLCGEIGTDVTDGSSTVIFDIANRNWSYDLIDKLGLNREIFPKLGEASQIAGGITKDISSELGLIETTPVVYGGGDSLMHSVGSGIIKPGVVSLNIGTACQLSTSSNIPVFDKGFRTNTFCHAEKDLWIVFGGHLNGGSVLKWLRDQYFPHLTYEDFTTLAGEVSAGSDGAIFLPYLSGERTPYLNPKAKGIYFGLTQTHGYKHMIRTAMEGVVLGLRLSLEIFNELGIPVDYIIASGGGANSDVWLQIQADIFNVPIYTTKGKEEACKGAAIMAGLGVGLYDSLEDACRLIIDYEDKVTYPIQENVEIYKKSFERFKSYTRIMWIFFKGHILNN